MIGVIAWIFSTITLFPIDTVLINSPITHTSYTCICDWCTTTNYLSPSTVPCVIENYFNEIALVVWIKLTYKTSRSLLNDLHTKWSRHMWFIAITFDSNVLCLIETHVGTTIIYTFWVCLRWALIATNCVNYNEKLQIELSPGSGRNLIK